jgi:hypothetical protein
MTNDEKAALKQLAEAIAEQRANLEWEHKQTHPGETLFTNAYTIRSLFPLLKRLGGDELVDVWFTKKAAVHRELSTNQTALDAEKQRTSANA